MSPALALFCREYQQLSATNLHVLTDIYAPDIYFADPAHHIQGITDLVAAVKYRLVAGLATAVSSAVALSKKRRCTLCQSRLKWAKLLLFK